MRDHKYFLFFLLLFMPCSFIRAPGVVIQNKHIRYEISDKGRNISFIDKTSGVNYLSEDSVSYCASVMLNGKTYRVSNAALKNNILQLSFKEADVSVNLKVENPDSGIVFEIESVHGAPESITFINVPLKLQGMPDEPFAVCVLSMNLNTHVFALPALQSHVKANSYKRFGLEGAKVTLLGVDQDSMLPAIRAVMKNNKEIPYSTAGGAWAQSSKEGFGSYLMNFGTLTEETTDEWIQMCRDLGFNQVDNHGGGGFFKFGDFELERKKWPEGWATFKKINRKLHDAGISSIFHTYAFFIDKNSKYVTPVPREDLGYFRTFTLAEPINAQATEIIVKESTTDLSLITGFFVRNSLTVRVGKELIEFSGFTKAPPYKLTGCKRAVHGTTASSYNANEKAFHLREMFGRFVPGTETPLYYEIAKRTAEIVNEADFDGIYFDAIDGSDILAGPENFWYSGGKFVVEVAKHLKRPVGMEMSSMIHLWWHYRSRWQAWDRPVRGYKRFIDIHLASIKSDEYEHGLWRGHSPLINKLAPAENGGLLLPLQLGWWGHQTWNPPQVEPTFTDDIEYLAAKMIGNNAGLAMLGGFDKKSLDENPQFKRLNAIIKQYEELRHSNYFNDSIRKILRQTGKDFKLFKNENGKWNFRPASYQKHKVAGLDHASAGWKVRNEFAAQPVKLRIEPLMAAKRYDDTASVILADHHRTSEFNNEEAADGVSGNLKRVSERLNKKENVIAFTAESNGSAARDASWIKLEKKFTPGLNLEWKQGLGVWIKGDGNGQLLNLRLESPHHISHGARGDHYIKIDFTGWKYFELVEIESSAFSDYVWPAPYSSSSFYVYDSYRHVLSFNNIDKLQLWYNNLPHGKKVNTLIGPVKALPLVPITITNPTITVGNHKLVIPVTMESGMYLELLSPSDCKLYGSKGEFLRGIKIPGNIPNLQEGDNELTFTCENKTDVNTRVQVTVISEGEPLIKY